MGVGVGARYGAENTDPHPDATLARRVDPPRKGEGNRPSLPLPRTYTSFTFFSGRLRTGFPVAARIAFATAGMTTQMVGSPTPPQKS